MKPSEENKPLIQALKNIKKQQEMVAGKGLARVSSIWRMADDALQEYEERKK